MSLITEAQLRQIAPRGRPDIIAAIASESGRVLPKYGFTTLARVQVFVGMCIEETGGLTAIDEDLQHYSAARIHQVWPRMFPTAASAAGCAYNARALGDRVYGYRMGNRPGTDDGYNFRGRGLIGITGRNNYTKLAHELGLDLLDRPDLLLDPAHLLEASAAVFTWWGDILVSSDHHLYQHVWNEIGGGPVNVHNHQVALTQTMAVIKSL